MEYSVRNHLIFLCIEVMVYTMKKDYITNKCLKKYPFSTLLQQNTPVVYHLPDSLSLKIYIGLNVDLNLA